MTPPHPEHPFQDAGPAPLPLPAAPVRLAGSGLVLREWTEDDLTAMAEAFDDPEVDRWTPLPSPFDRVAAADRLARARADRAVGKRLCLAITEDDGTPLGEVLVFHDSHFVGGGEIGYGLGAKHRGRGLVARAVRLMVGFAYDTLERERLVLRIDVGNEASNAVARATGFIPDGREPVVEITKGRRHVIGTWVHDKSAWVRHETGR